MYETLVTLEERELSAVRGGWGGSGDGGNWGGGCGGGNWGGGCGGGDGGWGGGWGGWGGGCHHHHHFCIDFDCDDLCLF